MRRKITDTLARTARCPVDKRDIIIRDTELRGFGLRVGRNATTFIFESSKVPRRVIGQWPAWNASQAREAAAEIRREADAAGAVLPRRKTAADVWARYVDLGFPALKRGGSVSQVERRARRRYVETYILPVIGKTALSQVTFADCEDIFRAVPQPYAANRCLETLQALFTWAIKWGWCKENPVRGVAKHDEYRCEDHLEPEQIEAVDAALPVDGASDLIRILLLTGCRPGEARRMTWAQVNLDTDKPVWFKPASGTKQRKPHRLPLSPDAVAIIRRQPLRGPLVFTQKKGQPVKPAMLFNRWKQALRDAGVPPVRLYACRHSVASVLANKGVPLAFVGAVLGHQKIATTMRYVDLYDEEVRKAVNVVSFPAGRKKTT